MLPPLMTGAGFPVLRSSARRRSAVTLTARQFRRALACALDDQQAETAYARITTDRKQGPEQGPLVVRGLQEEGSQMSDLPILCLSTAKGV